MDIVPQILLYALVAAFSPLVLVTTLTVLLSGRGRLNGTAYLIGFLLAQAVVCVVAFLIGTAATSEPLSGQATVLAILEIVLGSLLLAAGLQQRRHPDQRRERRPTPRVDALRAKLDLDTRLQNLRPRFAFFAGALLGVGPKRLVLTLLAVAEVSIAGLLRIEEAALAALFVVVASIPVLVPVGVYLIAGSHAQRWITETKAWLTANETNLKLYSTLVFGLLFVGDGLARLL